MGGDGGRYDCYHNAVVALRLHDERGKLNSAGSVALLLFLYIICMYTVPLGASCWFAGRLLACAAPPA